MSTDSPDAVAAAFVAAVNAQNLEAALELWTDDAIFIAAEGSPLVGRDTIRGSADRFDEQRHEDPLRDGHDVRGRRNRRACRSFEADQRQSPDNASELAGEYVTVCRRQTTDEGPVALSFMAPAVRASASARRTARAAAPRPGPVSANNPEVSLGLAGSAGRVPGRVIRAGKAFGRRADAGFPPQTACCPWRSRLTPPGRGVAPGRHCASRERPSPVTTEVSARLERANACSPKQSRATRWPGNWPIRRNVGVDRSGRWE